MGGVGNLGRFSFIFCRNNVKLDLGNNPIGFGPGIQYAHHPGQVNQGIYIDLL